jgi:hypothetical protein
MVPAVFLRRARSTDALLRQMKLLLPQFQGEAPHLELRLSGDQTT